MALADLGLSASTPRGEEGQLSALQQRAAAGEDSVGTRAEPAACCSRDGLHPEGWSSEHFTSVGSHIELLPCSIFSLLPCIFFCVGCCFFFFLPPPKVVYFKFPISTLDGGKAVAYMCCADPSPPPSKGFNNNRLFSVQQEGLQPCGIFPHSLKSSPLSGEESVSDVNVVLRVCKAFWSCLLSPQQDDKLRV